MIVLNQGSVNSAVSQIYSSLVANALEVCGLGQGGMHTHKHGNKDYSSEF